MSKKNSKKTIFYAKIDKGFIFKVALDGIMASNIQRAPLLLCEQGIITRVADRENVGAAHSMWDIFWERAQCGGYKCTTEMTILLTTKSVIKMLKTLKKKDCIVLYIRSPDLTKLWVETFPSNPQRANNPGARSEKTSFTIQVVDNPLIILPENPRKISIEPIAQNIVSKRKGKQQTIAIQPEEFKYVNAYENPIVIVAAEIQKAKQMASLCTTVTIIIQQDFYMSIRTDGNTILGKNLDFGQLTKNIDEKKDDSSSKSSDEESSADDSDEELKKYPCIYKQQFDVALLQPLIKLPPLCTKMSFYAPKFPDYPLKVQMRASTGLGDVTYYFKNKAQIEAIDGQ